MVMRRNVRISPHQAPHSGDRHHKRQKGLHPRCKSCCILASIAHERLAPAIGGAITSLEKRLFLLVANGHSVALYCILIRYVSQKGEGEKGMGKLRTWLDKINSRRTGGRVSRVLQLNILLLQVYSIMANRRNFLWPEMLENNHCKLEISRQCTI